MITSSIVFATGTPLYVHEKHVAHTGEIVTRFYVAAPGGDLDANLAGYAVLVEQQLAEQEAERLMYGG